MTDFETYVFLLCLIVFILLTTLSVVCIVIITRLTLRLIECGEEDNRIIKEHRRRHLKVVNLIARIVSYVFSGIVCVVFAFVFISSLLITVSEDSVSAETPVYRVVRTSSMAEKNPKNKYLVDNDLNDQIQAFDLIEVEALPGEMELELYDIVVYETDGMMIIHRIVGIEEPNAAHPDCRYFRLQGDAVDSSDRFPVKYEQMKAIYRGHRVPFVGSFVLFMQSPAGWLCMILIVLATIAAPILEKLIRDAEKSRAELYF